LEETTRARRAELRKREKHVARREHELRRAGVPTTHGGKRSSDSG
jgi:hypothetical protein